LHHYPKNSEVMQTVSLATAEMKLLVTILQWYLQRQTFPAHVTDKPACGRQVDAREEK